MRVIKGMAYACVWEEPGGKYSVKYSVMIERKGPGAACAAGFSEGNLTEIM